jgi:hypothetical protein
MTMIGETVHKDREERRKLAREAALVRAVSLADETRQHLRAKLPGWMFIKAGTAKGYDGHIYPTLEITSSRAEKSFWLRFMVECTTPSYAVVQEFKPVVTGSDYVRGESMRGGRRHSPRYALRKDGTVNVELMVKDIEQFFTRAAMEEEWMRRQIENGNKASAVLDRIIAEIPGARKVGSSVLLAAGPLTLNVEASQYGDGRLKVSTSADAGQDQILDLLRKLQAALS